MIINIINFADVARREKDEVSWDVSRVNNFGEISENFPFPLVTGKRNFGIFRYFPF